MLCAHYDCRMENARRRDVAGARAPTTTPAGSPRCWRSRALARRRRPASTPCASSPSPARSRDCGARPSTPTQLAADGVDRAPARSTSTWSASRRPTARSPSSATSATPSPGNDAASPAFGAVMAQAAADYTDAAGPARPDLRQRLHAVRGRRGCVDDRRVRGRGQPALPRHQRRRRPRSTTATSPHVTRMTLATLLQELLVAVDETSSGVDLFIRDSADRHRSPAEPGPALDVARHLGAQRRQRRRDNPELGHQPPINGQPNYLYVARAATAARLAAAGGHRARRARSAATPAPGMIWPRRLPPLGDARRSPSRSRRGRRSRVGPFIVDAADRRPRVPARHRAGAGDHAVPTSTRGSAQPRPARPLRQQRRASATSHP